jgi:hypothetical protein
MNSLLAALFFLVMDASTILNSVESHLTPLMTANDGRLVIAETLEDAIEMLQVAPSNWRVILTIDGDAPNESMNSAGLTTAQLVAYVQAPKGMEIPRRSLSHPTRRDSTPSFFTRRDWLIRKIRGLRLAHAEIDSVPHTFEYKGSVWFKIENLPAFRTQACTFEITYALDDPETDPDATDPVVLPSAFKIVGATDEFYIIALSGNAHGRVPRYLSVSGDPTGTASGYAIAAANDEFYAVTLHGAAHGRIPRFISA